FAVRRFTEKPALQVAQEYVARGNYQWNAGMFFWRVSTFLDNLRSHLPKTHAELEKLAAAIGTRSYEKRLRAIYPKLEDISVDYATHNRLQQHPAAPKVSVLPAEIGWSDIGSWAAVYELLASPGVVPGLSVSADPATGNLFLDPGAAVDAYGNLISVPKKF